MNEGVSFGPYRVVRKLGQGGMGTVFLCEHTLIGRRAAIKVLRRERSAQRESVERFFNEARATSAMEDPGIVQVYDFGVTSDGTAYLIMEYLDGEPLSARLRRRGALHPADAVRITRQIAGSLAAAHAAGIVHRDLKPENLFMIRDGEALGGERPKILDFGIAKLGDERERADRYRTRTGVVLGTPAYMSPEQCNGASKIDHRTDVYSLGCVLFHLLTGRPPFDLEGVGAIISGHLREPAPPPSTFAPAVPEVLDAIVARCLAKQPDDRFASMVELQQACDSVLAQLPAPSTVVSSEPLALQMMREDSITTLGHSVGESSLESARPLSLRVWLAIAGVAIAAGVVLAVTTNHGKGRDPAAAVAPGTAPGTAPASATAPETMAPGTANAPANTKAAAPESTHAPEGVPAPESENTPTAGSKEAPTHSEAGSDAELGAATATRVPSKPAPASTPVKRPSRGKALKKRRPIDSYEDRF